MIVLTLARWLLPTEATSEGETLWIAGLWFLLGAVWCFQSLRCGPIRRWDGADLAVCAFVGGHVLSGVMILVDTGDKRAACNLLWEWLSLGVLWFVWRGRWQSPQLRQCLISVMLATAVTLSLWGLWQHYVWYPEMRAEYGPVFDQIDEKDAAGKDAAAERKILRDAGIPADGPSRELFKNRLLNSQEPFGPFGLANTLGGMLAAWLLVGLCAALEHRRIPPMPSAGFALAAVLPVAACLYLTNSRTAWGGVIAALGAGGVLLMSRRSSSDLVRNMLFPAAVSAVCLAGAAALVWIMSGEHDLPGPLKSLSYRVEYWIGTWRLLSTTPIFGVGLGQFRDRYLQYRVPESSEEIADPHNLLLDIWANGGVIGLIGLLGLIGVLLRQLWALQGSPSATAETLRRSVANMPLVGLAAFPLIILGQLISTGVWDAHADLLVIFSVIWAGAAWLVTRFYPVNDGELRWAGPLAALALTVHLLGAGGIAMPAVAELWLLLIATGLPQRKPGAEQLSASGVRLAPLGGCLLCLVLLTGWFVTGWRPTMLAKQLLTEGDYLLSNTGDAERAERMYLQASAADPWSSEPWERIAEVSFSRAIRPQRTLDQQRWETAWQAQQAVIRRSPFRFRSYLREAELHAAKARISQQRADWDACLTAYAAAELRHPTQVRVLADFAMALAEAQRADAAGEMARKALRQDELNRRRGHLERFLPEETVRRLQKL